MNDNIPPIEEIIPPKDRVKILMTFANKDELNSTEIARLTKQDHESCLNHLKELAKFNVLQEKIFTETNWTCPYCGKSTNREIRVYRYRIENMKMRAFRDLCRYFSHKSFNMILNNFKLFEKLCD